MCVRRLFPALPRLTLPCLVCVTGPHCNYSIVVYGSGVKCTFHCADPFVGNWGGLFWTRVFPASPFTAELKATKQESSRLVTIVHDRAKAQQCEKGPYSFCKTVIAVFVHGRTLHCARFAGMSRLGSYRHVSSLARSLASLLSLVGRVKPKPT